MKYVLIFLLVFISSSSSFSQTKVDSLIAKYDAAKTEKEFADALYSVTDLFTLGDNQVFYPKNLEQSKKMALVFLAHVKKKSDDSNTNRLELFIASILNYSGDYTAALQMSLPLLDKMIVRKDTLLMYDAYQNVADAYLYSRNYANALINYQKIARLAELQTDKSRLAKAYNMLGEVYAKQHVPDSGLIYSQKAMTAATEANDQWIMKYILTTTGENYIAAQDYDLAIPFLKKSLKGIVDSKTFDTSIIVVYNDFAQAYLGMKMFDSSYHYSQKAIKVAKPIDWKDQLLRSYEYLYQNFEQTSQQDSTYKYFRLATTLKDSLFDIEKIKSIESISFQQQIKEQEEQLQLETLAQERHQNLQYALLAIGIITVIILFLLLSRSFITNTRVIKFFSVLVLLIVFEFLNLLLHPFLEKITHHSPVLMLLALVCIAALLVPMHHKIEHWATHRLVEKNKQIRLAAAKKTIEQLETTAEN